MNTSEYRMSVIFSEFKKAHLLQSDAMPNFLVPPHGKPGDLAIAMDHAVSVASGQARNHDHQHVPVALKLLLPDPSPDQGMTQRVRFCPDTTPPTPTEELEHARTGHLRPEHYNSSVSSCAASESAEDVRPWDSPTSPRTATEHAESIMIPPCTATEHAESIMTTPDVHAQDDCGPPCNAENHAHAQM